jgi:hypothetical protein
MDPSSLVLGVPAGALAGRALAALLPRVALRARAAWLAGALGGALAAVLVSTLAVSAGGIPIVQQSAGIDLAALLGRAGAGAFGGLAVALAAGLAARIARLR